MENKYYTPAVEDLHIGYQCEVFEGGDWRKETIDISHHFDIFTEGVKLGEIRTPYLTKEDIEAEGWVFQYEYRDGMEFEWNPETIWKDTPGGFLDFYPETHIIRISTTDGEYTADGPAISTKYKGYCFSINELRTVLNYLKPNR